MIRLGVNIRAMLLSSVSSSLPAGPHTYTTVQYMFQCKQVQMGDRGLEAEENVGVKNLL